MSETHSVKTYEVLALELLRKELGPFVESVTVREDVDYDDEPALFFDAWMDDDAPPDLGVGVMNGHWEVKKALESNNDLRFPYLTIRHKQSDYPDNFVLKQLSAKPVNRVRKRA